MLKTKQRGIKLKQLIAQYMNQNDPRMPKFAEGQENREPSFGKGNK